VVSLVLVLARSGSSTSSSYSIIVLLLSSSGSTIRPQNQTRSVVDKSFQQEREEAGPHLMILVAKVTVHATQSGKDILNHAVS
jgi:hypothetical protein